jgi:predicted RNA-binding protein YlxR (DUF448 family)
MLVRPDNSETDAGPRSAAAGAERLCVATRQVTPVADMIRCVAGPGGEVVPDLRRKLPGRGVWVTASRTAVETAVKRKAFARGFRQEVRVPDDFAARIEALLERAALDALAMANKAGLVVAGTTRVESALGSDRVVGLVHAADAAPDGVRKIAAAARHHLGPEGDDLPVVTAFTSLQLDLALGRSNVVHAALLAGGASDGFFARGHILERYRLNGPSDPG